VGQVGRWAGGQVGSDRSGTLLFRVRVPYLSFLIGGQVGPVGLVDLSRANRTSRTLICGHKEVGM